MRRGRIGSWVLLQPGRINAYAQAVIQTMRADEHERGGLAEERVLGGDLTYHRPKERLPADEERFVLLARPKILVERGLCLREHTDTGTMLIFPVVEREGLVAVRHFSIDGAGRPVDCAAMRRVASWLVLLSVGHACVTGCTSARRAEDSLLARHPIHETRMSTHAEEGYVPAAVWRVRGVHNTVYLAGTSHVVPEDQVPFPSSFYAAYGEAQIVYVEFDTDLSLWAKMRLMSRMWKWVKSHQDLVVLPQGKTLADHLSPETLAALHQRYGKDFSRERMTPVFLLFMNEAGVLDAKGEKPSGVEEPFQIMARRDGKPLRELDDGDVIDTALLIMDQTLLGYQREIAQRGADAVVREALLNGQSNEEADWRHGDLAAVVKMQEEMKKDSPLIYEKALPERNRKWMQKLEPLLHGKKNVMVLVGVAHMGGDDGLLNLLRQAGFPAEQMYGVDRPEATVPPTQR